MAETILRTLSNRFDLHFETVQQLRNGINLMLIAFKALYHQKNDFLASKLSNNKNESLSKSLLNQSVMSNQSTSTKPGNNVILINSLLKHLKNDKNIDLPRQIKQLTFYNILEEDLLLCKFVQWMISYDKKSSSQIREQSDFQLKSNHTPQHHFTDQQLQDHLQNIPSNRFKNIQIQVHNPKQHQKHKTQIQSKQIQQQNALQNLYFASNIKSKIQDSPPQMISQNNDKIVRKGSFKLLKPKVTFNQQNNPIQHPTEFKNQIKNKKRTSSIQQSDELRQISMIEVSQQNITQNINQPQPNFNQQSQLNDSIDEFISKKNINSTPSINRQQQNNRKTIPKNLSKPPLYRSSIKNKQNLHSQEKTVDQKLKKKNFFNFQTQNEESVSNFNYQTVKNTQDQYENHKPSEFNNIYERQNAIMSSFNPKNKNSGLKQKSLLKEKKPTYFIEQNNIIQEDDTNKSQLITSNHKKSQKQNNNQKDHTKNSSLLQLKNHFLKKQLYSLENEILSQQRQAININKIQEKNNQNHSESIQKSLQSLKNSHLKNESLSSTKRLSRKVSKFQIKQLQQRVKMEIIDWLDDLNIIDRSRIKLNSVVDIFSNGVKFVEICNHYIGRGKAIPYFSNPKKNAEIHSNFNKVFQHLKSFSQFLHKQLLFAYQLFVPYPQEAAIWSLLQGTYRLFNKKGKGNSNSIKKQESLILHKENQSVRKHQVIKEFESLQKKHNNTHKMQNQSENFNQPSKILTKRGQSSTSLRNQSHSSSRKQSTFSKPIQFVRQIPELPQHVDLIQQSEQPEQNDKNNVLMVQDGCVNGNVLTQGYKEKYLRRAIDSSASKQSKDHKKLTKNFSLQTPKKTSLMNQDSSFIVGDQSKKMNKTLINRSSSKKALESHIKKLQNSSQKLNSIRKNSNKKGSSKFPKITLSMQMKVSNLLSKFNLGTLLNQQSNNSKQFGSLQLFEDPIRNGTLINLLLGNLINNQIKHTKRPQTIQHCRQNYRNISACIKNKYGHQLFQSSNVFAQLVEEILKGEKNMFYALAYEMIKSIEKLNEENFNSINLVQNQQGHNYSSVSIKNTDRTSFNKSQMVRLYCENQIEWVRLLQMFNSSIASLKIRNLDSLYSSISEGQFLYSFLQNPSVKIVYQNAESLGQREGNLKKVIAYMIQMNIIQRESFVNIRQIAQKHIPSINNLIQKLLEYSVGKNWSYIEKNINNLKKMLLKQPSPKKIETINSSKHSFIQQERISMIQGYNRVGLDTSGVQIQNQNRNSNNFSKQYENNNRFNSNQISLTFQNNNKSYQKHNERDSEQFEVQIPWMRKLGFINCSLKINNGILLCRLISKLTRTNIKFNQNITHDAHIPKPEALANIRKALKLIPNSRVDELDVYQADERKTLEIYCLIRQRFRNNYEMGKVVSVR